MGAHKQAVFTLVAPLSQRDDWNMQKISKQFPLGVNIKFEKKKNQSHFLLHNTLFGGTCSPGVPLCSILDSPPSGHLQTSIKALCAVVFLHSLCVAPCNKMWSQVHNAAGILAPRCLHADEAQTCLLGVAHDSRRARRSRTALHTYLGVCVRACVVVCVRMYVCIHV